MYPPALTQDERLRYARTMILPEVGEQGQRRLKAASVLLVGAGGLGSSVAMHLATAGVGRIGIVDPETVDPSNLQRQIIHDTGMIGRLKVESASEKMFRLNPHVRVEIRADLFNASNADEISANYEILVDGTDNFRTRYLINNLCVRTGKTYVYGALYRFEGQVSVFDARKGPCYRCLFPEQPSADFVVNSEETGIFSALPGIVGTIQASEVLKLILGIGSPLLGRLLLYDALHMSFREVLFSKDPDCAICGGSHT
ncbi:MAG: molybdopterin-synthase adenylyltransferase MoeB [Pseudomonadota bacterium]